MSNATSLDDLEFNCLRSAYGNQDREIFFSFLHRSTMFLVVLGGTATFGALTSNVEWVRPQYIAFSITCLGLLDLVFDLSGKARIHSSLRHSFLSLLADVKSSDAAAEKLERNLHLLYAEEPPTYRAVEAMAFNAAVRSLGKDSTEQLRIPLIHRFLRHLIPFASADYQNHQEFAVVKSNPK